MLAFRAFLYFAVFTALLGYASASGTVPSPSTNEAARVVPQKADVFKCHDGSKTIAAFQVDDDYCDCADGSDEPHTSACAMLWDEKLFLGEKQAMFKCANTGVLEQSVPSHWLHDGFCDCCDGSDENPEQVKCPNTCGEAARNRAKRAKEQKQMRKVAAAIKAQMIKGALADRVQLQKRIPVMQQELTSIDGEIQKTLAVIAELEKREDEERAAIQLRHDEWAAKRLDYGRNCIGWRQTGNCDPLGKREESKDTDCFDAVDTGRSGYCECINGSSSDHTSSEGPTEAGSSSHAPPAAAKNIKLPQTVSSGAATHNEPAKGTTAAHGAKAVKATETSEDALLDEDDDPHDADEDYLSAEEFDIDSASTESWSPIAEKSGPNSSVRYNFTCKHEKLQCAYVCNHQGLTGVSDVSEPMKPYDYSIAGLNDAREKLSGHEEEKKQKEGELTKATNRLSHDANTEDYLYTLEGRTFLYDFQEYTYELKLFKGAWQNKKNGVSESGTLLGQWGSFAENTYSSWAKDKYDYSIMHYTQGWQCWNGIVRSTEVHIVCGADNKLTHVEEPSICTYKLVFETPAICEDEK